MDTGIGFSEIVVIAILCMVFFGSKEIPQLLRVVTKSVTKIRVYSDKAKNEINSIIRTIDSPQQNAPVFTRKAEKNELFSSKIKKLTDEQRGDCVQKITHHLKKHPLYAGATSILIYINKEDEVSTRKLIEEMLLSGKRVAVPYKATHAGYADTIEIVDCQKDIIQGTDNNWEPDPQRLRPFFKSDLHLAVCSGVAFDKQGMRLYKNRSAIDYALWELKGIIPIIGLAFDCQISSELLPSDFRDIRMTEIITESGCLMSTA